MRLKHVVEDFLLEAGKGALHLVGPRGHRVKGDEFEGNVGASHGDAGARSTYIYDVLPPWTPVARHPPRKSRLDLECFGASGQVPGTLEGFDSS